MTSRCALRTIWTARSIPHGNVAIHLWSSAAAPSRCLVDALRSPPCRQRPAALPRHSRKQACEQFRSMALGGLDDAPALVSGTAQSRRNRGGCADRGAAGISAAQRQGCSPSVLVACTWALAAGRWPSVAVAHVQVPKAAEPEIGLVECPFRPLWMEGWYSILAICVTHHASKAGRIRRRFRERGHRPLPNCN